MSDAECGYVCCSTRRSMEVAGPELRELSVRSERVRGFGCSSSTHNSHLLNPCVNIALLRDGVESNFHIRCFATTTTSVLRALASPQGYHEHLASCPLLRKIHLTARN
jgi:hypothetical protein